ncbi:MAG: hypothetical protein CLLPBCKN_008195 [Chroococcidiopsis cubana SAG 39.79]|nr:hypothetical protein [Chroococcidiopsis cubana SAG 39.79]
MKLVGAHSCAPLQIMYFMRFENGYEIPLNPPSKGGLEDPPKSPFKRGTLRILLTTDS